MLQKKYIIIIAIIVCLFILYYFYDEIASIKKLSVPTYQKTMSLEMRVAKLESKTSQNKQPPTKKVDSPLTITYQSDMVKNGTLSAKYIEVSESEANQLLKNIEKNKTNTTNTGKITMGEFSDSNDTNIKKTNNVLDIKNNKQKNIDLDFEASDTINVKIADLIKKNVNVNKSDTPTAEYQKIYDSLDASIIVPTQEDDIDPDIIYDISESIQYADIPSENTVSDIPVKSDKINVKIADLIKKNVNVNKSDIPVKSKTKTRKPTNKKHQKYSTK